MLKAIANTVRGWFGESKIPATKKKEIQSRVIAMLESRYANLRASYDAARTSTEYQNIWANADAFDADSAHSREVRHSLIQRSRYEVGSNGYSDGIAQTYATDLVGVGPSLQMQTGSDGFNKMVELQWSLWCKAVQFRRKFWCMAHCKHQDGEPFGVMRRNPGIRHAIKLDLTLYEPEQVQTPYLPFGEPGYIDGIKFDEFGNPVWYDILKEHPGTSNGIRFDMTPERVPADRVLHWFKMRRPGQHRAVPECTSTLNLGAAARRWREAVLAAAETIADFTIFLKTQFQPDSEELQYATDFSQQEISKRMMTALPVGYDVFQPKAEQPNANYAEFHKAIINEQARPKSMPYNKAACDSSSYNYASGRLDHQTYYSSLDVDREDANDLVLDPLFDVWFDLAIVRFGWLGGDPFAVSSGARLHLWDWPKHRVADVEAEANANRTKLESGQASIPQLKSEAGRDAEDDAQAEANYFGITIEDLKKRQLDSIYPPAQQLQQPQDKAIQAAVESALAALSRRSAGYLKSNGHANGAHANGN
jgi:capsid protein